MLRAMMAAGMTHRQVSAQLGRTMHGVQSRAMRLGVNVDPIRWNDTMDAVLQRMWQTTATAAEIGDAVGRSPSAVCKRAKLLGLARRGKGYVRPPSPIVKGAEEKHADRIATIRFETHYCEAADRNPG